MKKGKVFLGGTCNNSTWRDELIPLLKRAKINYFNPVVENWNEEAQAIEDKEKAEAAIELYVITPEMVGVYSIAEIMRAACKTPERTVFCFADNSPLDSVAFSPNMLRSLAKVGKDIESEGATFCKDLEEVLIVLKEKLCPPKEQKTEN
jgi:hypothetical protein